MRPEEAAPILLTLNDELVATIMRLVPEVRSQSKLMGALGAMDVKRAARISRIMGKPVRKKI
jgi:flagellar motility protein MotE (MotC chaperone)